MTNDRDFRGDLLHDGNDKNNDLYNGDEIFTENLLEKSKQHISFLKNLHSLGVTIRPPSSKSLERYLNRWLPLICQYSTDKKNHDNDDDDSDGCRRLIPPPDIAWLFHCHRLAPYRYASYCRKKFRIPNNRRLPDANPPFSFQLETGRVHCGTQKESEGTRKLWKQLFPDEPFFLHEEVENIHVASRSDAYAEGKVEASSSLLVDGFDLQGSADRQGTFLWQVSGPRFSDDEFLRDGIARYYKFILLRKCVLDERRLCREDNPPRNLGIIVPTYQIDLIWHTHILSSFTSYDRDCKSILDGFTLNHDDGLNDRSEGGTLDVAFRETKELWRNSYGENYCVQGGMYRGEPPKNYYSTKWDGSIPPSPCRLAGIHGATSTSIIEDTSGENVVWTWRETKSQMQNHLPLEIVGRPDDCWIRYDPLSNGILEQAYQENGGSGLCDLGTGYEVDFASMKQTKSSTGHKRDVCRHFGVFAVTNYLPPRGKTWTPISGYAPDGFPAFVEPKPKSTVYGVNANPKMQYYIFGRKGSQVGYFHITTKEAYEILEQRAKISASNQEANIALMQCCTLGLCSKSFYIKDAEDELQKVKDVQLIAQKRAKATGPDGDVELPERLKKDTTHFSRDGGWYFPQYYYVAGGGCGYYAGGSYGGTGDCDAGACGGGGGDGGAGCGAGGCGGGGGGGGGGCGGGGCGGGGCGG